MAALGLAFLAGASSGAFAQEDVTRPWSLKDLLYPKRERIQRPGQDQTADPASPPRPPVGAVPPGATAAEPRQKASPAGQPRKAAARPKATSQPAAAQAVTPPEPAPVEKAADARVVLVVGDFIAGAAAEGLEGLFAGDPKVRIVDRSNGASGLVRNDHFDWPAQIGGIIEAEKPAAVLIAVGANDRQPMRIGAAREALRSPAWVREYSARAASFASEVASKKTPLVWLGTPAFKSGRMNTDILAFNEIYRTVAADGGLEFVEVWDGFVDEAGKFITTGPDISGQPVRLRTEDGINLTAAGKRKLAFYSEKPLRRLLGLGAAPGPGGEPGALGGAPPAQQAPAIDRTVPMALGDPALDGGETLLGATVDIGRAAPPSEALSSSATPAVPAAVGVPAAVPGRVDDFLLPQQPAAAAGTDREATSALGGDALPAISAR